MSVYGATNVLNKAIPFFMMPVFTRYLSPRDYGIIAMFGVLMSITSVVSGFGVINAVSLKYYQRDKLDLAAFNGNCIYILLFSSGVIAVSLALLGHRIESLSGIPLPWVWVVLPLSIANFLSAMLLSLWQAAVKPLRYGLFQVLQTVAHVVLSLWFVVFLGMNWQGRIASQIMTTVVFAGIALILLHRAAWLSWTWNGEYLRNALKIGVPLLPHLLGGFIIDTTDRIMITNMVSVEDTGIYAVGSQVGMIVLFITSSFHMAWTPWLFSRLREADASWKRKIVRITYAYDAALLLLAGLLAAAAPLLFRGFVGRDFAGGVRYVLWIALGYAFNGMYMMVSNYLFFVEKTYLVAYVTICAALVNIGASYVLIRMHGAVGAAQGAMLAHLSSFILVWILSARVHPMPWRLRKGGRC